MDGKGYFTSSIDKKNFTFKFNIAQNGKMNLIVLEIICMLFGEGRLSEHSVEGVYEYKINGFKNCSNVFHILINTTY